MNTPSVGRPFQLADFVEALTAQLDTAQDRLALKARLGRPLTFAIKDLDVDLRVFWDLSARGDVVARHAGPNEEGSSTVRLSLTTITKPMIEENTQALTVDDDPRALNELRTSQLPEEDRRRLEFVGVRTVGQLRRLAGDARAVGPSLGIPVERLRAALAQAQRPAVLETRTVRRGKDELMAIRGVNFTSLVQPQVYMAGEPVEVVESNEREILVRPLAHHVSGDAELVLGSESAPFTWTREPRGRASEPLLEPLGMEDDA
jgi:hypothetical protein